MVMKLSCVHPLAWVMKHPDIWPHSGYAVRLFLDGMDSSEAGGLARYD